MVLFAFVFFYPIIYVILNAFKPDADITLHPMGFPTRLYLANFARAWSGMHFPIAFVNTLLITVFSLGGIILSSSMAAYMLARTDTRLSWTIYGYFVLALVIPFQIIMVPVGVLAADLHLMSVPGIIPMYWGLGCPTAIFMFHGFVKGVPRELEESAAIDGAGQFYIFFKIVFPLLKTIVATVAVIDALWLWNDFLLPLIVIKQGTIQLAQMIFNGQFLKEYGAMCASLTLSALPIVAFYLALQKYIIKGIAAGAVKG
jgi:raffinose/stachyose/melibiose transport system permease protein